MEQVSQRVFRIFKYFLFWMTFFWLSKALFLIFNWDQTSQLAFGEVWGIFWHGLKMDVSTACYLLLLPALLFSLCPYLPVGFVNRFTRVYSIVVVIITSILVVLDLGLYPHWGTRINVTVFNYINDPVAMSASVSVFDALKGLLMAGVLFAGFYFLYKRFFRKGFAVEGSVKWYAVFIQLFLVATLIIPIRGGLDTSPLNLSSVAFSPKMYVNQSASNFFWNFVKSVEKRKRFSNPCQYMEKEKSVQVFDDFMKSDSLVQRPQLVHLNPDHPTNVILVILESFSNKVIAPLGGLYGIAPNLDSLCTKSTVFTSFYSTGNRSDRGISAVLGGYPSLLSTSIMIYPEKSNSLTLLPEYFNRNKYHTSFYYGGDINFYNLKTFVLQGNYSSLITKSDFPSELGRMSKWGVPDGFVFAKALRDLESEKEPFMKTIYTISSHPPYDVPFSKIKGETNEAKYLNSVAYTDSCLGAFVDGFRKSPLWKNTLLIITADHGTLPPGPTDITEPASYRIPLIWSGGVVDSIQRIDRITQQIDFGTSLIHQLGWKTDSSRFSKDFFTAHPYAFYALDAGWGYVVPEGCFYFDQDSKRFIPQSSGDISAIDQSFPKAYMQVLHDDFISR